MVELTNIVEKLYYFKFKGLKYKLALLVPDLNAYKN
jgi:hypothetical protein